MSKLIAAVGLGTLAVGGGVGAVAATGGFGSFGNGEAGPTVPVLDSEIGDIKISSHTSIKLNGSKEFTKKHKSLPCAKKLFGNVNWRDENSENLSNDINSARVEITVVELGGCISVWWDKEIHDNNNWRGNWNLLWGMKDYQYGIVFVSTVVANNGLTQIDGTVYVLKQEGNVWKTVGSKTTEKIDLNDSTKDLIVRPVNSQGKSAEGWNFDFTSEKVCSENNICSSSSPQISTKSLIWDYRGSETSEDLCNNKDDNANAWSSNIDKWMGSGGKLGDISNIYENTSCTFKLASKS